MGATIPISDLLVRDETALTEMGYSFSTKLKYLKYASLNIQRHQNLEYLDPKVFLNYVQEIDEKFLAGSLKKHYYGDVWRAIKKFVTYMNIVQICPHYKGKDIGNKIFFFFIKTVGTDFCASCEFTHFE